MINSPLCIQQPFAGHEKISLLLSDEKGRRESITFNESEGDVVLSAELGKEDNEFDGINVVSDDNELSFLVLNKSGDVIKSVLDDNGLLGLNLLVLSLGLGSSDFSDFLLSSGFRRVLSEELEEIRS